MTQTIAETLSQHFAKLSYDSIPKKQIEDAQTLLLDYIGVALAGSQTESGRIAGEFARVTGGVAQAQLIGGKGQRLPAVHASFANAIASHSIELDDVDVLALFHFGPPVISAALAVAETVDASGRDLIAAMVGGCEMMARASDATNPSLRNRGYHTTPTCGVFGATITAAMLLKLTPDQITSALGTAGAQASGLMEMYGPSMQKRFNPGPAARNGVTSAVMAKLGFTGAATIFEGERGFCRAFSDQFDVSKLTAGLGKDFPIYIEYKPYSSARPLHNGIDCALDIRRQMHADAAEVDKINSIRLRRHPDWAHYHLNAMPTTYHEAQVSILYSIAVTLIDGAALLPQYRNERLNNPEILRLSKMIEVVADNSLPRGVSCHVTVGTKDGRSYIAQVDHPRGSIANPMTSEEMSRKVHMLGDEVVGVTGVDTLIELVGDIAKLADISDLMRLTQCQ